MTARKTPPTAKSSPPRRVSIARTADTTNPEHSPDATGPSTNGSSEPTPQPQTPRERPTPHSPVEVIVLGKKSVHKAEVKPLRDFGHALALRGNQLVIPNSPGAPAEVAIGFGEGGGTVKYLAKGEQPGERSIIIFTNSKMQEDLDRDKPGWRDRNWVIINNPKETQEAANMARIIAKERGTPIPD